MTATPGEADQEAQEDLYRLEAYRSQLNSLLQQHQLLTQSRADHLRARESLEGLETIEDGTELLVPLGADTFLRGTALPQGKVLVGLGSGVVVELERPRVSELLAQRLKRLEEAGKELEGQIRSVDERVQLVSQRLEALSQGGAPASGAEHVGGN